MGKQYLTSKMMCEELKISHENGVMSGKLGMAFITLVNNIANRGNFRGYTYIDDMKSDAIELLCNIWFKFDMTRTNPFAYFTTCVNNSFLNTLAKEKRQRDIKDDLRMEAGLAPSHNKQMEEAEYERHTD